MNSNLGDRQATTSVCVTLRNTPKNPTVTTPTALDNVVIDQYTVSISRLDGGPAPGPFTFILPATRLVPDLVLRRQKTVGVRLPASPIALEIVRRLEHPVISTSAATPAGEVLIDARDIRDQLGHGLELILDGGFQPNEPSTVIDLTGESPRVVRQGKGDASDL